MVRFRRQDDPPQQLLDTLAQGLNEHSLPYTNGVPGFVDKVGVFAHDDDGELVGGGAGLVNWNWFYVSVLWVSEDLRGQGVGRQLMARLEEAAREKGCRRIHLDTLGFQAREFYEALGFRVFATLDDYPPGYQRIFLEKSL